MAGIELVDFLMQLAIILFSTKMIGVLMRKLGLPQVLGFIVAGILIGPAIWELIFDLNPSNIFPIQDNAYLKAFAEVGVIFVMFTAGLETNLKQLKDVGLEAFLIALGGVLLPLGAGTLLGYLFLPDYGAFTWIFIGVIMTATSVGITVEVLRELNKLTTKVGTVILSAAIIDDVLGIMVLAIVLNLSGNGATSPVLAFINPNDVPVISILWILTFFVFAIGVGILLSKLFKFIERKSPHTRRIPIFSIATCLLYAFVAEKVFGVADITGAFIAGLILSTNHASAQYTDRRVTQSSYILFAPIFFARIGVSISLKTLNLNVLLFAVCFVLVAILMKIIGCGGIAKLFKYNFKDSCRIGFGMIARGEVALIVTQKGVSGGLIDSKYLAITVLLVLVSSLFAPIILKALYKGEDGSLPTKFELEEGRFE